MGDRRVLHVVSVSSGKDSTATLLLALERCLPGTMVPIFCDTGNEDAEVYSYLDYLERVLGITIHRLKADFTDRFAAKRMFIARDRRTRRDRRGRRVRWTNKAKRRALAHLHPTGNPFLDLCMLKGRFPSRKAQFCTEELKRNVAVEFQMELMDQGFNVVSWQGVRRDESEARRNAKKIERVAPKLWCFRPIVDWTVEQVFAAHRSRDIEPNPLYRQNMSRVGCMPCINCQKEELRTISVRKVDHIYRVADWERLVGACSKRGFSTFFSDSHSAPDRRQIFTDLNVWTRVEWSKTSRGGRQYNLLAGLDDNKACASAHGLCE